MDTKKIVGWILVVGAINWGLIGLLDLNLVESIFGPGSILTKAIYVIVGLAGAYKAYMMLTGGYKKK